MSSIFTKSSSGKNKVKLPDYHLDESLNIPADYLRDDLDLVDVNETEIVRHYTNLSLMNFGVDNGLYPLGSCTMKYNPKINEKLASLSFFNNLHPLFKPESKDLQTVLGIIFELGNFLSAITGMAKFSLAPAAGSHGELAGAMIIKKYFANKNDKRDTILIPDSAHGTNPASVAICGFKVKEIPSDSMGNVDLEQLRQNLDQNVAAMMLTAPNTLGLFDHNILEIAQLLHKNGSLFYGDGANLNAIIGQVKMRDLGFDLIHLNLHKTFATPHGGGGPGSGPIGVSEDLVNYLPLPSVVKKDNLFYFDYDSPDSIGRIHSFYGNFLVFLKAYFYLLLIGEEGIKKISENAVLNANYLMSKLKNDYNLPYDRLCLHEFVINDQNFPNKITTNEIAKRLLDYGFHAPTIYFPLLVPGAMMIEPTETESKDSLDNFLEVLLKIKSEASQSPELLKEAPIKTPVKKVNVVLAARKPILKWPR